MKITLVAIGVIKSPFKDLAEIPRQAVEGREYTAVAEIFPQYRDALEGLERYSKVVLIYYLHRMRGEEDFRGVFSTRSPHRPNPIGLSVVELLKVNEDSIEFRGVDMLDGTPLLDIKPFFSSLIPAATQPPGEETTRIAPPPPLTPPER